MHHFIKLIGDGVDALSLANGVFYILSMKTLVVAVARWSLVSPALIHVCSRHFEVSHDIIRGLIYY